MSDERCLCGLALHYTDPNAERAVRRLIAIHGETVIVGTSEGMWRVPRHFIALHGINANDLPALARRFGFEAVPVTGR